MLAQVPSSESFRTFLDSHGLFGIDGLGLLFVGGFAALGAARGLWWQVLRLVGLVLAAWAASSVTPLFAAKLADSTAELDPRLVRGTVWLLAFFLGLALFAAVGRLGHKLLKAMHLATLDRLGGAFAGALSGLLLHAALVASIAHLGTESFAERTLIGTRSGALYGALSQRVPLLLEDRIPIARLDSVPAPPSPAPELANPASEPAVNLVR